MTPEQKRKRAAHFCNDADIDGWNAEANRVTFHMGKFLLDAGVDGALVYDAMTYASQAELRRSRARNEAPLPPQWANKTGKENR